MIDYLATIDPAAGLATGRFVHPPSVQSPLWSVAINLGSEWAALNAPDGGDYPLMVGAFGLSMEDAFHRACGEAVERAALVPAGALWPGCAQIPAGRPGDRWVDRGLLWSADADLDLVSCFRGEVVATGEPVRVPIPLVDFPAASQGWFDPGPSGAASGVDLAMAQDSAARELLERDALMANWYGSRPGLRVDLDSAREHDQELDLLLSDVAEFDVETVVAAIESQVPGSFVMVAFLIDDRHHLAACGMGFSPEPSTSLVKALIEAVQVRVLMLSGLDADRDPPASIDATNDMERARLWASSLGVGAARAWARSLTGRFDDVPGTRPSDWRTLVPDLVWVDLTTRLPRPLQEMGWRTGKAIAPGLVPLRIDDSAGCHQSRPRVGLPHPII